MAPEPPKPTLDEHLPYQKRHKGNDEIPPVPENWDRCHAYLPKKRKYCRQLPVVSAASPAVIEHGDKNRSAMYCGNHLAIFALEKSNEGVNDISDKRIPCPLDATHCILESQLAKHLKKCPAAKRANVQRTSYYFTESINAGGYGPTNRVTIKGNLEWAQKLALRVLQVHQQVFAKKAATDIDPRLVSFNDIYSAIKTNDLSAKEFEQGIEQALLNYHVRSGGPKHVHQQASLVGHLRTRGAFRRLPEQPDLANSISTTILEVGAGRGMTGLTVAGVAAAALANVKLVMVERSGSRSKADTILRKAAMLKVADKHYMNLDQIDHARISCDLCHVNVRTVLQKEHDANGKLVVLAKHLCGVGTDFALKSIEPVKDKVSTCILATCCHGACAWKDYVGREFLCAVMDDSSNNFVFGLAEFDLLRRWCGGAVHVDVKGDNGGDAPGTDIDHPMQPSLDEGDDLGRHTLAIVEVVDSLKLRCGVRGLGRACQRLIDFGRFEYMRRVLFPRDSMSLDLCHYVSEDVTPQNAVLIASS